MDCVVRERPFTGASGRLITRVERALERQETLQIVQKMIYYITLYLPTGKKTVKIKLNYSR